MTRTIGAAAEGMPKISRRKAFAITIAGIAAALTGTAVAAAPVEEEALCDRASRLAWELADTLNTYLGGGFYAEIHPSLPNDHPVMFASIDAREWPHTNVSLPLAKLLDEHKAAREAFHKDCVATDCKEPSKTALRRWRRTNRAEDKAFDAVCAFAPYGRADALAKLNYILPFVRHRELTEDHITSLLFSAVSI